MLYLYHYKEAIPKIKEYLGDIPIILVLRDPVNRAYSNYHYQGRGQINDFEKALELEEQRKNKGKTKVFVLVGIIKRRVCIINAAFKYR